MKKKIQTSLQCLRLNTNHPLIIIILNNNNLLHLIITIIAVIVAIILKIKSDLRLVFSMFHLRVLTKMEFIITIIIITVNIFITITITIVIIIIRFSLFIFYQKKKVIPFYPLKLYLIF